MVVYLWLQVEVLFWKCNFMEEICELILFTTLGPFFFILNMNGAEQGQLYEVSGSVVV